MEKKYAAKRKTEKIYIEKRPMKKRYIDIYKIHRKKK